jgi:hypothetical protein
MLARPSAALIALCFALLPTGAGAQQHEHSAGMKHGADSLPGAPRAATLPGQDAFGAIAEVVKILRADPNTNWGKVNLESLRQHLIDMNAVTLGTTVTSEAVDGGLRMTISGTGRAREAVRRMVGAHGQVLMTEGLRGEAEEIPTGVRWTVTTTDPRRLAELRALGFIGIMALGDHHTTHHLQLARGDEVAGHGH